jgi:hypothetical protein
MLTAFFLTDKFNGNIMGQTGFSADPAKDGNYVANVSDPRPRVRWICGADTPAQHQNMRLFTVDDDNKYIEISATPSGGITTLTLTANLYSAGGLASHISTLLAATGFSDWSCSYLSVGKFLFTRASTGTAYFRWKTGTHGSDGDGTSMAKEMGFDDSSDQTALDHGIAAELRFDTTTMIRFDTAVDGALQNMFAWLCDVDTSGGVDDSLPIKAYGTQTPITFSVSAWAASATTTLTFSPQPAYTENPIRLATVEGGTNERYWLWVWRHQDEVRRHKVGLCKAFDRTWSGTRTISTLRGHGMQQPQRGLGINNYYPVTQLRRWNVPLSFDSWGAADYRTVIQGVVRHGKAGGLLWALRWDEIADGTYDAEDEADRGFLVWGALQDYSLDSFVGEGADYMSGSLRIEQIR